jgi:hypothetical protein
MMVRSGDLARNEYKLVADTKNDPLPPQADSFRSRLSRYIYPSPFSHVSIADTCPTYSIKEDW